MTETGLNYPDGSTGFVEIKMNPQVVQVTTSNPNAHIVLRGPNSRGSVGRGEHYAVQVGGRVYDAFTGLNGVPAGDYLNLFMTNPGVQMTTQFVSSGALK